LSARKSTVSYLRGSLDYLNLSLLTRLRSEADALKTNSTVSSLTGIWGKTNAENDFLYIF